MRRLTIVLLSACLLGAGSAPAIAQEPGPPPWLGGRVQMPELRFAVTIPDDWVAFDTAVDFVAQLEAASDALDPTLWSPADTEMVSVYSAMASEGIKLAGVHATSHDSCGIGIYRVSAPISDVADFLYEGYLERLTTRDVQPPRAIDLAAGDTYFISTSELFDADADTWIPTGLYLIGADERMVLLSCTTEGARPEDDWLSIAETVELLPETRGPVVVGGRIELPDAGFAIDVPDDWRAADLGHPDTIEQLGSMGGSSASLAEALEGHLGASFVDRVPLGHEMVLWASPAHEGLENRQHCEAYVLHTVMTSIGQFVELNATHSKDDPTQTWERVDLPAGEAARNDYRWSPESFGSDYTFHDGRRFVTLSCVQGIPVEGVDEAARRDAWRSIAETFEFVPE